ncbi:MAG: hypothetical protein EBV19_06750 [Flavobacteriia bacterium]|nr:hypothetical protein [Flavobacteriia bacterium]
MTAVIFAVVYPIIKKVYLPNYIIDELPNNTPSDNNLHPPSAHCPSMRDQFILPQQGFFIDTYYSLQEPEVYPKLLERVDKLSSIVRVGYIITSDKIYSSEIPANSTTGTIQQGWYFLCYPSTVATKIATDSNNKDILTSPLGSLLFLGPDPTYTISNGIICDANAKPKIMTNQVIPKWESVDPYNDMLRFQKTFNYKLSKQTVGNPVDTISRESRSLRDSTDPFVIASSFAVVPCFKKDIGSLNPDHVEDVALFAATALDILVNTIGAKIDAAECFNEPDGNWGCVFQPTDFANCIKNIYKYKNQYVPNVMLLAPGLSQSTAAPNQTLQDYLYYLDPNVVDGYSFHLWDNAYTKNVKGSFDSTVVSEVISLFRQHGGKNKPIYCTEFGKNSPRIPNFVYQGDVYNIGDMNVDQWNFVFYPGINNSFPLYQSFTEFPDAQDLAPESVSLLFGLWIQLLLNTDLAGIIYSSPRARSILKTRF